MKLSDFNRNMLHSEISHLITRTSNLVINSSKKAPEEEILTREVARHISCGLYDILSSCVKGYSFAVHSIFCHKFPRVTFVQDNTKHCELGDLLFIFDEEKLDFGNALLLQAKKLKGIEFKPVGNEKTQFDLYTKEPEFKYILAKDTRKIPVTDDFDGAQYLMMFPPYDNGCMYRCVLPKNVIGKSLASTDFFSDRLVRMFAGEIGEYQKMQNPSDDWSKIIQDFLERKNKNNYVLEQLKKRDYSIRNGIFLYEMPDFDETKINPSFSVETFSTKNGIASFYTDCGKNGVEQKNGDARPFLVIYIDAFEKNEDLKNN